MVNTTAHSILDVAELLTQTRGFNAFSYKDLQHAVGIKTSSIHYHFPTKADLAEQMVLRYSDNFQAQLSDIRARCDCPVQQLEALAEIYRAALEEDRFCLCGMLASEMNSLPMTVQERLQEFFAATKAWIRECIELGQRQSVLAGSAQQTDAFAAMYLSVLEGGMLIARLSQQKEYFNGVVESALAQLNLVSRQ